MQFYCHLMLGNFISYQRNKAENKAKFWLLCRTYPTILLGLLNMFFKNIYCCAYDPSSPPQRSLWHFNAQRNIQQPSFPLALSDSDIDRHPAGVGDSAAK